MKFIFCSRYATATSRKGFTLLELLVVVMIIGLISSMAIPQYRRSVYRAEMIEGMSHGKTIYDSALRYKSVNGSAPTNFNQLDVGFAGTTINGNSFTNGSFTYILNTDNTTIQNTKAGYRLEMRFPTVSSSGVSAPIYCCPRTGNQDGEWLCKNASGGVRSGSCYEIK